VRVHDVAKHICQALGSEGNAPLMEAPDIWSAHAEPLVVTAAAAAAAAASAAATAAAFSASAAASAAATAAAAKADATGDDADAAAADAAAAVATTATAAAAAAANSDKSSYNPIKGALLSDGDVMALRQFVAEFITRSLLPNMVGLHGTRHHQCFCVRRNACVRCPVL